MGATAAGRLRVRPTSSTYPGAIGLPTPSQYLHTAQAPVRFTAGTHALNLKQGAPSTSTATPPASPASTPRPTREVFRRTRIGQPAVVEQAMGRQTPALFAQLDEEQRE
ncbi:hypothetical protein ACWCY6_14045 [Streptomyces sp. 900105755]